MKFLDNEKSGKHFKSSKKYQKCKLELSETVIFFKVHRQNLFLRFLEKVFLYKMKVFPKMRKNKNLQILCLCDIMEKNNFGAIFF